LFERAGQLYRDLGDVRGEAEALFWTGCCHQVIWRGRVARASRIFRASPGQRGAYLTSVNGQALSSQADTAS